MAERSPTSRRCTTSRRPVPPAPVAGQPSARRPPGKRPRRFGEASVATVVRTGPHPNPPMVLDRWLVRPAVYPFAQAFEAELGAEREEFRARHAAPDKVIERTGDCGIGGQACEPPIQDHLG